MNFTDNLEEAEKLDNLKNKMLNYIVYKKRTEQEVRQKFQDQDEDLLEDAIEALKSAGYINDFDYINRAIAEMTALKNISIKEMEYKLIQKGLSKNIVDDYICKNKESMLEYELHSAKNIIIKKRNSGMEDADIKNFLFKKGFMSESVSIAFDEV